MHDVDTHPLQYLLRAAGWSALDFLARLDTVHRDLGYGPIAHDRKRVSRWIRSGVVPESSAQQAMAAMHGIPADLINARPWPHWLTLACTRHRLLDDPWTPALALEHLDRTAAQGDPMDRRGFLIIMGISPSSPKPPTPSPPTPAAPVGALGLGLQACSSSHLPCYAARTTSSGPTTCTTRPGRSCA
ncbi:hypothetical protein [Acrocarpospora sp. B8E8]|uniref:hypothetical protein n=1 Tax=Acrocarpospora sp. B8E8 TaxID=3153572 RepID=UPI00325F1978